MEQERLRVWKARHARELIKYHSKERDRGVIESIVQKRNTEKKKAAVENRQPMLGRPELPPEDRAIYSEASERVYFWG
jgi:hypothetical protein